MIKTEKLRKLLKKIEKGNKTLKMTDPESCLVGRAWKWFRKEPLPIENTNCKLKEWFANYFGVPLEVTERIYTSTEASQEEILIVLKVLARKYQLFT